MRGAATGVVRALYPPTCLACGALTEEEHALCAPCWREAGFLAGGLVCDLCGLPLPGRDDGLMAPHCDDCLARGRPWERGRAALPYRGTTRALALALKHGDRTDLAVPLGRWMARAAGPVMAGAARPVLVPVPLHRWRLWSRRSNQAAALAWAAGAALGVEVIPDALLRVRHTASLGTLGARARAEALEGAIAPHPRRTLAGRTVVLVDDVMASGSTLAAAAVAAHEGGAVGVRVLVLARALRE